MHQPVFCSWGLLLGMLEWDLRPTIWLQLAMPLWLGKPSSSLRNSLTLLPCLAKFPKNANVMGKSILQASAGYIKGGKIAMPFPANRMLGVTFVGGNHVLSKWKFLFDSISCSLCFFSSFDGSNASFVFSMPVVCVKSCVLRVVVPPALCE